jgi:hypothetical protein
MKKTDGGKPARTVDVCTGKVLDKQYIDADSGSGSRKENKCCYDHDSGLSRDSSEFFYYDVAPVAQHS